MPAAATKRVADATRFQPNVRQPKGETPQQRVARLREAARRAKDNQITTFDKIVWHGRIWADRLHRGTVYGIIGFSIVMTTFLGYALTGVVRQARSNKKEYNDWVKEEKVKFEKTWRTAQIGYLMEAGLDEPAAAEAFEAIEAARKARNTQWGKFMTWTKGGLTPAEQEYTAEYELQEERMRAFVLQILRHDRKERLDRGIGPPGLLAQQALAAAQAEAFPADAAGLDAKDSSSFLPDSNTVLGNAGKTDSPIISEAKSSKSGFTSWFTKG